MNAREFWPGIPSPAFPVYKCIGRRGLGAPLCSPEVCGLLLLQMSGLMLQPAGHLPHLPPLHRWPHATSVSGAICLRMGGLGSNLG